MTDDPLRKNDLRRISTTEDKSGPSSPLSPTKSHSSIHSVHSLPPLPDIPRNPRGQGVFGNRPRKASNPPAFAPLTHTATRLSTRSNKTFVEAPGLVAALGGLTREDTRIRRIETHAEDGEEGVGKEVAVEVIEGQEIVYPDGGKEAWLVLFGGVCALFCGFGLTAALGGFQTYYRSDLLSTYPSATIAWIPATQAFVTFFLTAFTGSMFDKYGHRPLMFIGTICTVIGFMMLSLCHEYWQLIIVHATLIPVGNNLIFISPVGVVGQWFYVRRGLAFGLLMSGASIGAMVWPLILANLPQRIGFGWTCRLMGLMTLILGTTSFILMRTRLPPKPPGPFFYFEAFRTWAYCFISIASFTYVFAFFSFLTFIGTYGQLQGLGDFSSYLLIIANGASLFGRLSLGLSADYIGPFNITCIALIIQVLLYWLWTAFKTLPSLVVFAILFGYWSGAYVALQAPLASCTASDMRYAGTMVGQVMFFQSFAQLAGPPAFGALLGNGTLEQQREIAPKAVALGASMMTVSAMLMVAARFALEKKIKMKV